MLAKTMSLRMKKNSKVPGKAMLIIALMVLGGGAKGAAIEREGEILFEPEQSVNYYGRVFTYRLDTTGDFVEDHEMSLASSNNGGAQVVNTLLRYLRPGVKIVFEDEGLGPREGFGAGRMLGFIMTNGNYISLEQLLSPAIIQQYFPRLWAKVQAEQQGGR